MPAEAKPSSDSSARARSDIVGLLLAGGLARRMGGGDKCLRLLAGRPILAHIVERLTPQTRHLVLNVNGDPARFAEFRLPVTVDSIAGFAGPLAGVLAGLDWAASHAPECPLLLSVPSDAPFLPRDLARRLHSARAAEDADIALAASNGRQHPVVGLWPVALRENLRRALAEEGARKVDLWTARYRLAVVDFAIDRVDPFFNANRPEDLAEAEALMAAGAAC
jgi:molybdopterin-guanine dinucleotide biosynthesis protein A